MEKASQAFKDVNLAVEQELELEKFDSREAVNVNRHLHRMKDFQRLSTSLRSSRLDNESSFNSSERGSRYSMESSSNAIV